MRGRECQKFSKSDFKHHFDWLFVEKFSRRASKFGKIRSSKQFTGAWKINLVDLKKVKKISTIFQHSSSKSSCARHCAWGHIRVLKKWKKKTKKNFSQLKVFVPTIELGWNFVFGCFSFLSLCFPRKFSYHWYIKWHPLQSWFERTLKDFPVSRKTWWKFWVLV